MNDSKTGGKSMFWSAAMGAAAGAAAILLSDRKTRDMLKKKVNTLMEDIDETKEEGKKKLAAGVKKAKDTLSKMQDD